MDVSIHKNVFLHSSTYLYIYVQIISRLLYQNPNYTDVIFQEICLCQRLSAAVFNSLKYMCGLHCRSEKNLSFEISMCVLASHLDEESTDSHDNAVLYQAGVLEARWTMSPNKPGRHIDIILHFSGLLYHL